MTDKYGNAHKGSKQAHLLKHIPYVVPLPTLSTHTIRIHHSLGSSHKFRNIPDQ